MNDARENDERLQRAADAWPTVLSGRIGDHSPWDLAVWAAETLPVQVQRLPPDLLATPELRVLRSIVVARSRNDHEECAMELYEAARELAQAGKFRWAEVALRYWNEIVHAMSLEYEEIARHGCLLLEEFPELAHASPLTVATVAAIASAANMTDTAEGLWAEALANDVTRRSSNDYWRVHLLWAAHHLMPRQANFSLAVRILRRGRNHFFNRVTEDAVDQGHFASINLVFALVLMGDSEGAAEEAVSDLSHFAEGSIHAAFLHAALAMACADLGRLTEAEAALDKARSHSFENNMGFQIGLVGPTALLIAGARSDARSAQRIVGRLIRLERSAQPYAEDKVRWRIFAGQALCQCGLPAAAATQLRDALAYAEQAAVPYERAWALLRLYSVMDQQDRAAIASRILQEASQLGAYDLITRREPRTGPAAIIEAVANGATDAERRFALRVLSSLSPVHVRQCLRDMHAKHPQVHHDVARLLDELGWSEPAPAIVERAPAEAPHVRVRLLGGFSVWRDGVDLTASERWQGRRKARLLLARLLFADGRPVYRDELLHDLWDEDLDRRRGSANLRPLVHALRRVIEPRDDADKAKPLVVTTGGAYQVVLDGRMSCDYHDFLSAAEECLRHQDVDDVMNAGWRAMSVDGGTFLEGEAPDEWILQARLRCEEERRATVLHMAARAEPCGRLKELAQPLQDLLESDPGCEAACRFMMLLLHDCGELERTSAVYHRTADYLQSELGLLPGAETRQLYSRLIGG